MVKSKAWDWDKVDMPIWQEPSEDVYYYLHRWRQKGFTNFLDLGCGIGRHSILFAENGFKVYAIDLSKSGIKKLRETVNNKDLNIEIVIGDMRKLPYSSEQFDCILSYHTIYHTDTKGIIEAINEVYRVLKVRGEIFLTLNSKKSPAFNNPYYKKIDRNTILKTEGPEVDVPHYYATVDEVKSLLSKFQILRLRQVEDIFNNESKWHYHVHAKK